MSSLAWTKATRQTQAAENGVQSVLQSTLADVINDLLSKPPFGQGSSHRIYWRLAGGGGGGQADLELVLEYENRAGQRERRILAVIEVKKSSALSVVGMGMLDDAVRDSGMWLDHQGKARVGIGREEDAVDRKYKAIFEQVAAEMSTRSSPICLLTNWAGYRLFSRSEALSPDFNYALTMSDTVPVTARATRDRLWRSPLGMLLGVTLLGLEEAGLTAQAWGISRAGAEYEEEEEQEQEQVGEGDSLETLRTPHGVDGPNLSGVGTLSERSGGQGSVRMFGRGEGSWEGMGRPMGGGPTTTSRLDIDVASIRPKHEAVTVVPGVTPPTRTFSSPSSSETDNPPPKDTFKLRWRSPHCRSTRSRLLRPNDLKLYPSQNLPLTPPVTPLADTRVNELGRVQLIIASSSSGLSHSSHNLGGLIELNQPFFGPLRLDHPTNPTVPYLLPAPRRLNPTRNITPTTTQRRITLNMSEHRGHGGLWEAFSLSCTSPFSSASSSTEAKTKMIAKLAVPIDFPDSVEISYSRTLLTRVEARKGILSEAKVFAGPLRGLQGVVVPRFGGLMGGLQNRVGTDPKTKAEANSSDVEGEKRHGSREMRDGEDDGEDGEDGLVEMWVLIHEDVGFPMRPGENLIAPVRDQILSLYTQLHDSGVIHGDVAWHHVLAHPPRSLSHLGKGKGFERGIRMTGAVDTRSIRLIDFGLAKTRYSLVDGGSAFGIGFGSDRMAEEGRDEEGEVDGEGRLEKLVDDARWGEMCADEMEEVREMLGMV